MSVDIHYLKSRGISSGAYRKIFTAEHGVRPRRINNLIALVSDRVREGREQKISDYKAYWAIDLAYEKPACQTKATMTREWLCQKWDSPEAMMASLGTWGLQESDVFIDGEIDGTKGKILNPPVLYDTIIPIVQAYVKIRLSKIFNERNTSPLLPYEPLKMTRYNEVVCEIVTDLVETISTWFGYHNLLHDQIFQALKYGMAFAFPREEWYVEEQTHWVDKQPKRVTVKEGLRHVIPHPTRVFWDMMYPAHTFNNDTGCEYAGYWSIMRYGDVLDNRDYWNRKMISYGSDWFLQPLAINYFQEVFPCRLSFPVLEGGNKREDRVAWYATADRDRAVFVAEVFMKIRPSDWGLGEYEDASLKKLKATYDYPVWHKFTMAGDDTIIWAEPCAYNPVLFLGYDYDPNSARNSSLALECVPTQDQVSNLVTQMLITAKENLTNVIFYDTNMVDAGDIRKLEYKGDRRILTTQYIGYDSQKISRAATGPQQAFTPVQLTKNQVQECLQMVNTVINLLERTLQISAQESGAAASHQQSKEEIIQTGGASSNRLEYTASFVDEFIDALKRQIFEAYQAYGDSTISAQVSADIQNLEGYLEQLGFKKVDEGEEKHLVTGSKDKLRIEGFARSNKGPHLPEDKEQSQVLFQVVGTVAGQEDLRQKIGAKNLLQIIEWGAKLGGAPRGFRLRFSPNTKDEEVPEVIKNAIAEAQKATLGAIEEKLAKPIAGEMAQDKQRLDQMEQLLQKLQGIYQIAESNQDKLKLKTAETQQRMQQKDEGFKQEQARKDAETHAYIQRELAKARAEIQTMFEKAKAETHIKAATAAKTGTEEPTASEPVGA